MLEAHDRSRPAARRTAAALITAALAATAALGAPPARAADTPGDPLERMNRATFKFNDAIDRAVARPVAKAYKAVVPGPLRQAVSNVLSNLWYPTVIVNNLLQGKFKDAGSDSLRFLSNTTFGLGGIFDPASRLGLPVHDQDFGSTLGHWGVPPGPYLVLPLLGPSDFRDAPAKLIDRYTGGDYNLKLINDGGGATGSTGLQYGLEGARLLDRRAELLSTDVALQQAFDRYAVLRNAYVSRRQYLVLDGNIPEETYDDPAGDAAPPATGPKADSPTDPATATPAEPKSAPPAEPKADAPPDPKAGPAETSTDASAASGPEAEPATAAAPPATPDACS